MALKLKGEASFSHDGEELVVAINVGVMMEAEAETGIGLLGIHNGILNLRLTASLLRHGLAVGCGKDITLADAAEILMTSETAHAAVIRAFEGFLPAAPEQDGDDENPPKAAGNGAGTTS